MKPRFPSFVAYHAITLEGGDDLLTRFADITLPSSLDRAVAARKLSFLAGRFAAREALRSLGEHGDEVIAIGEGRAPVWPRGIVGSITHTDGLAAAAVAYERDTGGVGIDAEDLRTAAGKVDATTAAQLLTPGELEPLIGDLSDLRAFTLVFSAKESVFKALYRHVGRYFDFHDVALIALDVSGGSFVAELRSDLGPCACGDRVEGEVAIDGDHAHTSVVLPPGVYRFDEARCAPSRHTRSVATSSST